MARWPVPMLPGMSLDRRRVLLTMAAAACVLLQGACGGSPNTAEPVALPSKNVGSAQATSTPTTPPNVLADRFVRAYLDEIGRAASSGETMTLRGMIAPECPCMAVADYIDKATATGTVRNFRYMVHDFRVDDSQPGLITTTVRYSVPEVTEINRDGSTRARFPAVAPAQKVVKVRPASQWQQWRIVNVANL